MDKNIDAAAYKNNQDQDEKLPSMKNKIDRNDKTDCWTKNIMENLNWLPFIYVMELTVDKIKSYINLCP